MLSAYGVVDRPEPDAPFTVSEIRHVLFKNGKSSASLNWITNRLLCYHDDKVIEIFTKEINNVRAIGQVSIEWRNTTVVLIPKSDKPPHVDSLRQISLTSCLGNVAEHAIHGINIVLFVRSFIHSSGHGVRRAT